MFTSECFLCPLVFLFCKAFVFLFCSSFLFLSSTLSAVCSPFFLFLFSSNSWLFSLPLVLYSFLEGTVFLLLPLFYLCFPILSRRLALLELVFFVEKPNFFVSQSSAFASFFHPLLRGKTELVFSTRRSPSSMQVRNKKHRLGLKLWLKLATRNLNVGKHVQVRLRLANSVVWASLLK